MIPHYPSFYEGGSYSKIDTLYNCLIRSKKDVIISWLNNKPQLQRSAFFSIGEQGGAKGVLPLEKKFMTPPQHSK